MADSQGGRARGRGRARAKQPGEQVQQPSRAPAAGPPPGMAAGPPPGMAAAKPAPAPSGRATHRGAGRPVEEHTAGLAQQFGQMSVGGAGGGNGNNGNGNGAAPVGRGNMRGKRQIFVNTVKTRPETLSTKQGYTGQKIVLQANYYSLVAQTDWCLYQYRVDFAPDIDLTGERKKLLRVQKKNIGGEYIFDGTVMYCSHRIPADPLEVFSVRESDDSQVRVTIKLVGQLQTGDSHYLQFFNILTRKCLTMLNLQIINRDYFDPRAKVEVRGYDLELWPGYKTTIRQHELSVLMCAEITHKVMRTDTCYRLLEDISRSSRDFKADFTRAVVGSVVLTDYNNKTYMISDVNWNEKPSSTFDRNGTRVSYIQYYQERYNLKIRDSNQPLLVSKSKPRERRAIEQKAVEKAGDADPNLILLIPELCRLTGLSDDMRSNFNLMREMARHTRIAPGERRDRLDVMNQRLSGEERIRQEFTNWNMKLSNKLVDIPSRILPGEKLYVGNKIEIPAGDECDWTKHLRSNPMFAMPPDGLQRWVVLYPSRVGQDVGEFVSNLTRAGKGMRFSLSEPEYVEMADDRTQTYVDRLEYIISRMNPLLVVVVLMNNKADRYSAVKKKSLVDRAVPTQVVLAKNLNKKGGMSIATKIVIQMNCKIGGAPWAVQVPLSGIMVVGFDVCHDSKSKGASYGAMVASLNKNLSRYYSAVSHHKTGAELSNYLAANIVKALRSYQKLNSNTLPSHIILYRDGVGDGQIPYVFEHEVQQINQALKDVYGAQSPKFAFVIVCKQINTRIFLGRNNPPPGTVVDDVITLPERYDFFIVSQFTNQGTVSPTSYNVIHDTLGLDPDKLQRLTYKLTHGYYNWSGTVRVPAPVQYAHKLAFLVSQSLYRAPNHSLSELLYFL